MFKYKQATPYIRFAQQHEALRVRCLSRSVLRRVVCCPEHVHPSAWISSWRSLLRLLASPERYGTLRQFPSTCPHPSGRPCHEYNPASIPYSRSRIIHVISIRNAFSTSLFHTSKSFPCSRSVACNRTLVSCLDIVPLCTISTVSGTAYADSFTTRVTVRFCAYSLPGERSPT